MLNQVVALGTLVRIRGGKRLPAGRDLQQVPNSHPYIRVRDVGSRLLPSEGLEYVPDDIFPSIARYIVETNDVVISIVGTIGALSFIDARYHKASLTENCAKLTGLDKLDSLYLYYYLSSSFGQEEIRKGTVGAVQPKLPLYNISNIQVRWPIEKSERAHVASLLASLDDKIELNRKINQTLEQMAPALFQAWFVDFEPVKAKVAALTDGRDPLRAAMSTLSGKTDAELDELPGAAFDTLAATAALFPKEIEESGEIPRGWEAATLGKYVTPSGVSVTAEDLKGDEAYFGLEHLPRNSIALDAWGQTAGLESGKRRFSQGTILFGKLRPYFHKVGVAPLDGVCSTDILALQPRTPPWFGYALVHLSSDALIAFAERLSNGAKMPRVGWKDLENYPVVAPGEQLAAKFNEHVKSSVDAIRENIFEARTLATLRDSLLPKLLSGELAVTPEEQGPERRGIEKGVREGRGIERTWD